MRRLLSLLKTACLLFAWVQACTVSVSAQTTVAPSPMAFAGWLDKAGTATVDTVQEQAIWEPFTGWKSWGYGPEPVWLRITVPASSSVDAPSNILIVRPPYLDRVTFFDPAAGVVRRAGDALPSREDALGSVLFTFEVRARTEARDVLVKLQTSSARLVHLSLMPLAEAQSFTRWVEWATGSTLLLSLVFTVWALVQWRVSRDRVTAAFAFKQFLVTAWGFLLLGFARVTVGEAFEEGVLTQLSSLAGCLLVCAVLWFFASLLAEYAARAWMLRVLWAGGWLALGLALFSIVGPTHLAMRWANVLASVMLGWILLSMWLTQHTKTPLAIPRTVMLVYVCFYVVLNAISTLTHLDLLPESRILFFGNMSNLVANGFVMLIILGVRQRRFRAQHEAMASQLLQQLAQDRLNQQYLEDQRKLLAMLAHEMTTPLANLRIWMEAGPKGRPVMERAIGDMDRVIERCVHAGQLSDQSLQPRPDWLDAAELTQALVDSSRLPERVQMSLPVDGCAVYTDAQMLSIVLSNLLENAYKYSAPDTLIDMALSASPGTGGEAGWTWRAENAAGAAGLPDATQVFDKYYRSPHAHRQSGSGLGLFLVKSLVELMGGSVRYTPLDGRARFEVWLPCEPARRPA
jgi:signal transduction histidine kinase